MSDDKYAELPRRIGFDETVVEVEPYEAVEPIRGVRRVSPLSPVAGIDEARLYAEIATDGRVAPWRRRSARATAVTMLVMTVVSLGFAAYSYLQLWAR
ncbi:MAG TPA: hypothetical protein VNA14_12390 [Mycobacteriales bacterium]|nr:hypothetical protein [Mycobacteriales bacterium]